MRSAKVNVGDSGLATQYNNLRADAYGGSLLLVHQQSSPGMTLAVEPGTCYVGSTKVIYAGGNTPSFTAPVTNPRIDIVTIDNTGTIAITQGTENASPMAPAYPANKLVLAEIYNRTSETAIYDTDQGAGKGYIYNDVRPILGGSYIASDSQVDAAANISVSKLNTGAVNADLIPDATNTRALGTAAKQWLNMYAQNIYLNGNPIASAKFGGTGADGALSVSSGTTTIDLGGNKLVIKNYSSISITGTGKIAFINPHANGTVIILKSQGNVILTSSTVPCIDASGMGGAGGIAGVGTTSAGDGSQGWGILDDLTTHKGISGSGSPIATTQLANRNFYLKSDNVIWRNDVFLVPGSGGGGGSGTNSPSNGGVGGAGGGALYIQCAGALNFTGTISVSGIAGSNAPNQSANIKTGGGGGGGSAGMCVILYNTLTANSGTITSTGGAGGAGGTGSGGPGSGAGQGGAGAGSWAGQGGNGSTTSGNPGGNASGAGAGGGGGHGFATGESNSAGGSGGSSDGGVILQNTEFV